MGRKINMLRTLAISIKLITTAALSVFALQIFAQVSQGTIIANTNLALPSSYNFQEYVFPEPMDEGTCSGEINDNAILSDVFISQTHRHSLSHPFHFTIGHRPALFQVALTGSGLSPDVKIKGFLGDTPIGELCLRGPESLPNSIDIDTPNFTDYFSVTIPKSWIRQDLSLELYVGPTIARLISQEDLKVGPYTEMNLVMLEMDVLDYNTAPHRWPIINDFLQETASAIPASVVRYGTFPERLVFPQLVAANGQPEVVRLNGKADMTETMDDGWINSVMSQFTKSLHKATGDYQSTFYFGNTLNLAPGGWGGGKSFVSFDFDDVYIHELGHSFSLPHWGTALRTNSLNPRYDYLYPYSPDGNGGGRGKAWNFIQDIYEFRDPICKYQERGDRGTETSDAMQRNNHCLGKRSNSQGPWDGFGDFSALAMHNFLVGTQGATGVVNYRGEDKDFQLRGQPGFPILTLQDGIRTYSRDLSQVGNGIPNPESIESNFVSGSELHNQDAYLVYGTIHPTQPQGNIVYRPISFNGTIPAIHDPTSPSTIENIRDGRISEQLLLNKDITLKITYDDASVLHAIVPWSSPARPSSYESQENPWYGRWRYDLDNFALVVPRVGVIEKVELYHLPINPGDINESSHLKLMDDAVLLTEWSTSSESAEIEAAAVATIQRDARGIGDQVWYDLNRDGTHDLGEPGIPGVSIYLWGDTDADGVPDAGISGPIRVTDTEGKYRFSTLRPGAYNAFVWLANNWATGSTGPLAEMIPSGNRALDPNNDSDRDNNACFLGASVPLAIPDCNAQARRDISSGVINLQDSEEPTNDGDALSIYSAYDSMGNMTIDFGFHYPDARSFYVNGLLVIPNLLANGANYYLELELADFSTTAFKLKTLKAAAPTDEVSATLAENSLVDIPSLSVNGLRYHINLNVSLLGRLGELLLLNNDYGNLPSDLTNLISLTSLDFSDNFEGSSTTDWVPPFSVSSDRLLTNTPPVVNISDTNREIPDTDSAAGESVSFTGTATDNDGTIATTQWFVDGVEVATGLSATLSLPNGSTVVTFRATDDLGASAETTTTSTIIVEAPNVSPTVSISGGTREIPDTDSAAGESVSFTGTATDSDGTIRTTQWLVGGIEVATGLSATLSLPNGSTTVTFKATDDRGKSSTTTTRITVEAPNVSPIVSIFDGSLTIPDTDRAAGESVSFTGTATDSDGTIATTQWFVDGVEVATGITPTTELLAKPRMLLLAGQSNMEGNIDSDLANTIFGLLANNESATLKKSLEDAINYWYQNHNDGYPMYAYSEATTTSVVEELIRLKSTGLLGSQLTRPHATVMCSFNDQPVAKLEQNCGNSFGPELTLGHYSATSAEARIPEQISPPDTSLIKVAVGGTNLHTDWLSPTAAALTAKEVGPHYTTLKRRIQSLSSEPASVNPNCVNKKCEWSAFIWFQGENDSYDAVSAMAYESNLRAFIADVRAEIGSPDLPVVIVGTGYWAQSFEYGELVTIAQKAIADNDVNVAFVKTDDLSRYFHYDPPSQMIIGARIGVALDELLPFGDVQVSTVLEPTISLPNGVNVVTFRATDNLGANAETTTTITVASPAYEPTAEWPSPYNGVTPDLSFGLAFNNIGVFSASDSIIYTCLRVFTDGLPGSVDGMRELDIGLEMVSQSEATVQITTFREFNAIGALNENAQTPDCSGKFETTTGVYTDIIMVDDSILETEWSLIDPINLILKLDGQKELTAN